MLNPVAFSCYKKLNFQKCEDSERTESRKPGKQTKGGFDLARQKDENRDYGENKGPCREVKRYFRYSRIGYLRILRSQEDEARQQLYSRN